ncbi:2,3-dihydro-2,3-dihydroxybenzoate dehydrogenase [Saccharopolyspora erythraea]|uniref:2,3-dihydro-2,3-dihydroxybenzoate dehydrogenase n=1 Tax=Saccharopolyspora erythraea TaxID=1836 RepID=UPI001BAC0889|nr:2,3-dihydro-2,3-dihydroxybenzoate dehydrogenase [Saccharopolyspora erythraea]QUH02726.1 2,3-dihydro-2,3-dihydroxybenzoate dehydrogenase [Saccharopolyspora erythraea]
MDRTGIAGKVALVSGAGRGIGAAVATALSGLGAVIAAVDVDAGEVTAVAARLAEQGGKAEPYVADVADAASVAGVVDRVERDLGPIDILANVAGVLHPGTVHELADEDWHRTFAVNTDGVFHLCREVTRRMVPRERGCVVTVGSNAAGVPRHGMAAYAASKAAATLFTKSLGLELAEHGIRCNVVSPGSTDTDMLRALLAGEGDARQVIQGSPETFKVGIPLRKIATPEDVADAVVFLASDRAGHITMHDLYVDGGATLRA